VIARRHSPVVDVFFFASIFTVTFAKIQWEFAASLSLSDVLTALFLLAFALHRLEAFDGRVTRCATVALAFFAAFLIVYLLGFFNLETSQALTQWAKGMVKFVIHFLFLVCGLALVARRGERFYWGALAVFCVGIWANALYGLVQLGYAEATGGANLDEIFVHPITGGISNINLFGAVEGQGIYRPNALTGDPNHLGIELLVPLLVLLPIYLRLEKGHRLRIPLGIGLMFGLVMQIATLSRSGLLGLACGMLVLLIPYRRRLLSARFIVPLVGVAVVLFAIVERRSDFFSKVLESRLQTSGRGTDTHLLVYSFIPDVLQQHPLLGLGYNNFSVYYEFVTGRTNFGPHSFYVATFVETGLVGAVVFGAFIVYLFLRLSLTRRVGRALATAGDAVSARVRPLGWGLTAALVGTLVANSFYLTMSFYYFFVLALLAIAPPAVFARRLLVRRPAPAA
jgi:O-antigen ligase/polysaccharide polymerase Wzy-like membrane protein